MPRFVVLTHDHPMLHWDLLLEQNTDCRTWRLLSEPSGTMPIVAESIVPHRKHYLDYEGPVSGNRGKVSQWDCGQFELISETEDNVRVELNGQKLVGAAQITQVDGERWQFEMHAESDAEESSTGSL